MKDCLKITKITKHNNRIEYNYEAFGKWNDLLNLDEKMFVEYDANIEKVPNGVAIIPLMCNLLPISWVFDLEISVAGLDETFYNCLGDIKKGYQDMYPSIKMLGGLKVSKIEKNEYSAKKHGTFFSGGVDAFNTLLNNIDKKPSLITVWGSDITIDNKSGWNIVSSHIKKVADDFDLDYSFIKSNFRTFINYRELSNYVRKFVVGEWWHEFQHGIGLLGLSAPLAYVNKFEIVYIASSFSVEEAGKFTCASDPTIDNYLKFASCKIVHDGFEYHRQKKIKNICDWSDKHSKNSISLRVCWQSSKGKNCCECEKCYRTMLGIIARKKNPNDFGFELTEEKRKKMMKKAKKYVKYDTLHFYSYIQSDFLENYLLSETPSDLIWLRDIKIKDKKPIYIKTWDYIILILEKVKKRLIK